MVSLLQKHQTVRFQGVSITANYPKNQVKDLDVPRVYYVRAYDPWRRTPADAIEINGVVWKHDEEIGEAAQLIYKASQAGDITNIQGERFKERSQQIYNQAAAIITRRLNALFQEAKQSFQGRESIASILLPEAKDIPKATRHRLGDDLINRVLHTMTGQGGKNPSWFIRPDPYGPQTDGEGVPPGEDRPAFPRTKLEMEI